MPADRRRQTIECDWDALEAIAFSAPGTQIVNHPTLGYAELLTANYRYVAPLREVSRG